MARNRRGGGADGPARVSDHAVHRRLRSPEVFMMTTLLNPELHLRIVGVLLLALVALNLYVPRRFNWRDELRALSLLNRQIFQVHAAFICIMLAMFAALALFYSSDLLEPTPLARAVLAL